MRSARNIFESRSINILYGLIIVTLFPGCYWVWHSQLTMGNEAYKILWILLCVEGILSALLFLTASWLIYQKKIHSGTIAFVAVCFVAMSFVLVVLNAVYENFRMYDV